MCACECLYVNVYLFLCLNEWVYLALCVILYASLSKSLCLNSVKALLLHKYNENLTLTWIDDHGTKTTLRESHLSVHHGLKRVLSYVLNWIMWIAKSLGVIKRCWWKTKVDLNKRFFHYTESLRWERCKCTLCVPSLVSSSLYSHTRVFDHESEDIFVKEGHVGFVKGVFQEQDCITEHALCNGWPGQHTFCSLSVGFKHKNKFAWLRDYRDHA